MHSSDFAELKALEAVVDRASFARAAEHLGLSRSALSQTIRQLESRLGVRLLNRTTRSVSPTEPGRRLHERMAPLLRDMDDAVAQAAHLAEPGDAVVLSPACTSWDAYRDYAERGDVFRREVEALMAER